MSNSLNVGGYPTEAILHKAIEEPIHIPYTDARMNSAARQVAPPRWPGLRAPPPTGFIWASI
jgi:hypothetical protein